MRISELPLVNNPSTTDDLPIDRNGVTYRVKYQALRGPQGEPGVNGTNGQDGTIENLNVTATTLAPGSSATASYSGNLLTLGIPRGNTGAKGNTGNTGPTGNGIASIAKTGTEGRVDTYTITMTNGTTSTFTVTNGMDVVGGITNTVSGSVAAFSDAGDDLAVDNLTVGIEPVQAGSGTPSPTNVRPITGWTGTQVVHAKKNLLGPIATGTSTLGDVTFTANADGSISLSGTASSNISYWLNTTNVNSQHRYPIAGRTQYTLSGCPSGGSTTTYRLVGYLDIGTTYVNRSLSDVGGGSSANTSDVVFNSIRVMIDIKSGTVCNGLVFRPQLELGSVATNYELYDGTTLEIAFPTPPGTVYGGTLDVTNGKLTVDRANIASYAGETLPGAWISSMDAYASGATPTTGAQVVYELDTPLTYDITPTEVKTDLGYNAFLADTGSTTVLYYTDTYVDVLNNVLAMIPMDTALSTTSENAVQNKVIAAAVNAKANSADVYTKTQVDTALGNKANSADVYTKTQVDTSLATKLDKDLSTLTALPQAPASSDLLAIRSGSSTYKVSYQAIASNSIKEWTKEFGSVSVSTSNGTTVTLGYPTGYVSSTNRILAVILEYAWPLQQWNNGAIVVLNDTREYINDDSGEVKLTTTSAQTYNLVFRVLWV